MVKVSDSTIEDRINKLRDSAFTWSRCPVRSKGSLPQIAPSAASLTACALDGCIRFHRAHFLDVFVNHLPRRVAHFGKRVISYEYDNEKNLGNITLLFADGTKDTCNVLVGCDGVKSTIRSQLYREEYLSQPPDSIPNYDPVFSGTIAYRGLVPVEELRGANKPTHCTVANPMMVCQIVCRPCS